MKETTKEPQYARCLQLRDQNGLSTFGLMSNQVWEDDPRRIVFLLSRYKFVSKMFSGKKKVLEVGCADAFGTRIVKQEVSSLTAVDFDPVFIEDVKSRMREPWTFEAKVHDMIRGPIRDGFDGAYALDVLEHIPERDEQKFVKNIVDSLAPQGELIIGMPSIQSQAYASPPSREGHVNCKDEGSLRRLMNAYFDHVFIFSMNDEVVHTGFYPMAHYLFALCAGKRQA